MALSVSGFPEPSRQSAAPNEIFNGDNSQDGYTKATLINSPRLRGLFGANNGPTRKPEAKNQSTSGKLETEGDLNQYSVNSTTPPTTPSLSFPSSSFEPLSQQEYELELQLPMNAPIDQPKSGGSKRAQLPPLPRKTTPSPVRLSPSLARLEIGGTWTRPPPTLYSHSKPPPPSVFAQEWGAKGAEPSLSSVQSSRPLPSVPAGNNNESGNVVQNAVAGPSRLPNAPTVPMATAGPSRNPNAFAGSSDHVNAVAGPSKHPNALVSPNLPSPTMTASPPSKVLITQSTPQQGHKSNTPSVSMRYQPLVADLAASSSDVVPDSITSTSSPIRPLPRIPPAPSTSIVQILDLAKVKRPKTSPSSITGFTIPSGSKAAPASFSRSPFDITTNTRVRPPDWNVQRANSPPLPISNGKGLPRTRSHSRTRRDRSLDSANSRAAIARLNASSSPPTGGSTWVRTPHRPPLKHLPSPTIGGARPLPMKAATLDHIPFGSSKPLHISTSNVTSTTTSKVFSPTALGKRSQPPSPPTGPVNQRTRPTPSPISSPTIHAPTPSHTSRTPPALLTDVLVQSPSEVAEQESRQDQLSIYESQSMMESPLHSHPIDVLTDNESLLQPPVSPITTDSPIEVFVDDQDLSTMSRDHSPIRYARPDSRGNLSTSSDEDDIEKENSSSSSSSPSSRNSSLNRRRRTEQLRSYRNSYRPHDDGRSSPPHIPYRTENTHTSTPPSEQTLEADKASKKKKEGRKVRSYFGGAASAPGTRASSPERKSRSRQPRRLAEAVSSALEDVRSRGRGASISPRRKSTKALITSIPSVVPSTVVESPPVVEESEVLDIRLPSLSRRGTMDTASSSTSENLGGRSRRWSNGGGWARVISKKRTAGDHGSSGSLSIPHLTSNLVTAVELDSAETPYMWVSATKPPVTPAPFIPPPPPSLHHHRRTDSFNLDDHQLSISNRQQLDIEVDKHGITCGLALGGGGGGPGGVGKSKQTDSTTISAVTTSRPSSSITTPFSNFSFTGRNSKKKRTTSVAVASPSSASAAEESFSSQMEKDASSYRTRKYSEKSYPSESDLPAVMARRILRSVDQDGDVHEHEQETAVVDIIPHLRNLKASKS